MRSSALSILVAAALLGLAAASAVQAEGPPRVRLQLHVIHLSSEPGGIDPGAQDLHRRLHKQFRYESLRVLGSRRFDLGLDEIGEHALPTGRSVRVRPLDVRADGVLIAVDVESVLQTDLRVKRHHQAIIGAQSFQGGQLVITLEPDY